MATLSISFLFSMVLLLLPHSTSTALVCNKRYCGSPERELPIEFPFQIIEGNNQSNRCGYPGFEVFCNDRKQELLKLSEELGEFFVNYISLENQRIWINDPNACLPRRLMQNMDLNDSPFLWDNYNFENITILNCTKLAANLIIEGLLHPIPCLSNDNYSIVYALNSSPEFWKSSCNEIGFALVPVKDHSQDASTIEEGLYSDIVLKWNTPLCECEADQHCGFLTDTGLAITCYNNYNFTRPGGSPRTSSPGHRSVIFFKIVWGISGFLFFSWIVLSVCKGRRHSEQRRTNIESNIREPPGVVVVLDGSRIEQYPKFQVNESGQFSKSIDKVSSICLGEYEPMETLRSMPQCNHYFHVHCIDAWLKMNATCPLCRNHPEGSALVTSSLSRSTTSY